LPLLGFATGAVGTPISIDPRSSAHAARDEKPINDCSLSDFENQTSGGSPFVKDCQAIADYFVKAGGTPIHGLPERFMCYRSPNH